MTEKHQKQHAQESLILFGSTPQLVFEEFGQKVESELAEGVKDLALFSNDAAASDRLLELLRKAYLRNVDVAEGYACRNIFSIQNFSLSRRTQIVKAFVATDSKNNNAMQDENKSNQSDEHQANDAQDNDDAFYKLPTKKEIPSPQDMERVQQELSELRQKLRDSKQRKKELLVQLQALAKTDQEQKAATRILTNVTKDSNTPLEESVHNDVSDVSMGKVGLGDCIQDANALAEQMNQLKRQRADQGDDDAVLEPAPKKLTAKEQYQKDMTRMTSTAKDMATFNEIVKKD